MTLEIGSGAMEEQASSADLSCVLCRNWGNGKIRKQLGAWLWFSNSYYKSQSAGDPVEDLLTMSLHRVRREDGFNPTFMWTKLESCYCLYVWYWYEFDQVLLFVDFFFYIESVNLVWHESIYQRKDIFCSYLEKNQTRASYTYQCYLTSVTRL